MQIPPKSDDDWVDNVGGFSKRFFDRQSVLDLFGNWEIEAMEERVILRYEKPKWIWEMCLRAA